MVGFHRLIGKSSSARAEAKMTLADQNGFCLSQRMSQVQLETPKQTQPGGLEPLQPQQPHPWEQQVNGRTTFGLDDDSQDILCSQDFFW